LPGDERLRTDLAAGDLDVLSRDGGPDIRCGQLVFVQLERVEPDAYRVFTAEDLDLADAVNAR
jgi:hypothetical protein